MERTYNKLVRDNIPDIIIANNETPVTRILTDEEYKMSYKEANKLIAQLTGNVEKLKIFTDKYLKYFNEKLCK